MGHIKSSVYIAFLCKVDCIQVQETLQIVTACNKCPQNFDVGREGAEAALESERDIGAAQTAVMFTVASI